MGAVRFDDFVLDALRRILRRGKQDISLRPQSLDVLVYLVEHGERAVSKRELLERFWPKAGTEDSLAHCIRDIRVALGESGHTVIKTVPRHGFRFEAEVSAVPETMQGPMPAAARNIYARIERLISQRDARPSRLLGLGALTALALVAIAAVGPALWGRADELTMMAEPSIVLLPPGPLGDETDAALATLADEIATGIWRAPRGFKPNIRPASAVKDRLGDPATIGREVGARYVVRSSARREGDVAHINVVLVEAHGGRQMSIGAFEYRLSEPGAQDRTAARIGRILASELLRLEARRPLPASPKAGHFVVLGRALLSDGRSAKTDAEAIALFEKAIAMDPENFLALSYFAKITADHILDGWAPESEHADRLDKAQDAVSRAIRLQPNSAGAHVSYGAVLRARGEYDQAIKVFERALALNKYFASAHAELGRVMIDVGRSEETERHVKRAIDLSPTDSALYIWCYWAGLAALYADRRKLALDWLVRSHAANRGYDDASWLMAVAYAHDGKEAEARKAMQDFLELRPHVTLADLGKRNSRLHPAIVPQWTRIRATVKGLGIPEGLQKAVSAH
jgi:DNA-binding winged helix-turn-helix (wHTH) protein/tetratricopeptide (TPR) repeat protein